LSCGLCFSFVVVQDQKILTMIHRHLSRRLRAFPGLAGCRRWQSGDDGGRDGGRWDNGSGGLHWKERHLTERRDRALEYMFDVTKRKPITDGLREQSLRNQDRLRLKNDEIGGAVNRDDTDASTVLLDTLTPGIEEALARERDARRLSRAADASANALLADTAFDAMNEGFDELNTSFLSPDDATLLAEEIYGSASADAENRKEKIVREWFRLRRESPLHQGFQRVPTAERTQWSPWYLRDLGPKE
jgi:hypothetical protein